MVLSDSEEGSRSTGLKHLPPGKPQRHKMVEPVLTSSHPDPCKALLDEPLTGTFHHPSAQRQAQFLVSGIVDVCTVPLPIHLHRPQSLPCRVGYSLHVQGLGQVAQHPVGMAMAQAVPCPSDPSVCLGGASIAPGGCTLPEVLRRVVKGQDACRSPSTTLVKQAPHPSAPITEPDDLGSVPEALAQRCEPETRLEGFGIPYDGHEPTLRQPGDHLSC